METPSDQPRDAVSQLCLKCGLCCNGVLFADVQLERGDEVRRLRELGLAVSRKGRKWRLQQPCSCFDGSRCRVYGERPSRCRAFECRLLQRVQAGERTVASALGSIRSARGQAESVSELLRKLGQTEDSISLSRRYAKLMAEPIDLSRGEEMAELRGELMMAVHRLMETLQREFLE